MKSSLYRRAAPSLERAHRALAFALCVASGCHLPTNFVEDSSAESGGPDSGADAGIRPQLDSSVGLDAAVVHDGGRLNEDSGIQSAAVVVSPSVLVTSEGIADRANIHVSLSREPYFPVQFILSVQDATEGWLSDHAILFDNDNWATGVDIGLYSLDDDDSDYDQTYDVTLAWAEGDPTFTEAAAKVRVVNQDNDTLRVVIDKDIVETHELGTAATLNVRLSRRPTEEVVVRFVTGATDEIIFSRETVRFTPDNWNVPQALQVVGLDDLWRDGNQTLLVQALIDDHISASMVVINRELSVERVTGDFSLKWSLSSTGRYLVFSSTSPDLVASDNNEALDVFVRDMATGFVERVSVANDGAESDGPSFDSDISPDGQYVYFYSIANNLVSSESGDDPSVFRRDRVAHTTTRVPLAYASDTPRLSENGAYLLLRGGAGLSVYETVTGGVEDVGIDLFGIPFSTFVAVPPCDRCLSNDGRYAILWERSSKSQLYLRDRVLKQTRRLTRTDENRASKGELVAASMSGDGRIVLFVSSAADLLTPPAQPYSLIAYDTTTNQLWQPTILGQDGLPMHESWDNVSVSEDGKTVVLRETTWPEYDMFVVHLPEVRTEPASAVRFASTENINGLIPAEITMSANARYVAFSTTARLVPEDRDDQIDLYVMQLP